MKIRLQWAEAGSTKLAQLIPSPRWRWHERSEMTEGSSCFCYVCCILLQFLTLSCWFVFVFKSFYLILFMTEKYAKGPGTGLVSRMTLWVDNTALSHPASLKLATNCWRYCRFGKQIREYLDITQSLHSLPLASLSCTRCKNSSELGFHSFA